MMELPTKPRMYGGKYVCSMHYCLAQVDEEGDMCLRCEKLVHNAECEAQEEAHENVYEENGFANKEDLDSWRGA
jgi:hypothetical protein